jgi:hypothetical protein
MDTETASKLNKLLQDMRESLYPREACAVRVGDSAVHGRSVFASRAISEGALVTPYPMDALAIGPANANDITPWGTIDTASQEFKRHITADNSPYFYHSRTRCIGDPAQVHDP